MLHDSYNLYPRVRAVVHLMPLLSDDGEPENQYLLTSVEVEPQKRGQGHARALMQRVLAEADRFHATLYLTIQPDGTGLGYHELLNWYERLGFTMLSDGETMIRSPHPTPLR